MAFKYSEEQTLKVLNDYITGTYEGHYTSGSDPSGSNKIQTLDLINSIGDAEAFCRSSAIKYLSRFGKKNGRNNFDLLKAMHFIILLYHFANCHDNGDGLTEYR